MHDGTGTNDDEIREPTDEEIAELTSRGMTPEIARLVASRLHELAAADREEIRRLNRWRLVTGWLTIAICVALGGYSLQQYDRYGSPVLAFMTGTGFTVAGALVDYVIFRRPR
jgi:hypothetical protein